MSCDLVWMGDRIVFMEDFNGNFCTGLDRPPGRSDSVASGITGGVLRYFTPDPLPDLLQRCQPLGGFAPVGLSDEIYMSLALAGAASCARGQVDRKQAALFCNLIMGQIDLHTSQDIISLGRQVSPRAVGIRREMVYADALIPSMARQIYAHHECLHDLMESLQDALNRPWEIDVSIVASVVGFFCAQMHPFVDGNGRWTRLMVVSAGAKRGRTIDGMICAIFLNICKSVLANEIWPESRICGLRAYLEASSRFNAVFRQLLSTEFIADMVWLSTSLAGLAKSARLKASFLAKIYSEGDISPEILKKELGISTKVANAYICQAREQCASVFVSDMKINIKPIWSLTSDAAEMAKKTVFY